MRLDDGRLRVKYGPLVHVIEPLSHEQASALADASGVEIDGLMAAARQRRDRAYGRVVTFSPKVFLPLTNLCLNRCDYCSFRKSPNDPGAHTMLHDEVERVLAAGAAAGCCEALICIGDKPERAFTAYREDLRVRGHEDTVAFIAWASERALAHGLLAHTNAGVLSLADMLRLRDTNVSLGLMLENVSERLCARGMAHQNAPDKHPRLRLAMLRAAGELRIPVTTGLLLGIGETRRERIDTLLAIRDLSREFGHVQEVIVQNFVPRSGIRMADANTTEDAEMAHAVAMARLILDDDVAVQAPPNLNPTRTQLLLDAGINDFGGISPVTVDFINPEQPWPSLARLDQQCAEQGFLLRPRTPLYARYHGTEFVSPALEAALGHAVAQLETGFSRVGQDAALGAGVRP